MRTTWHCFNIRLYPVSRRNKSIDTWSYIWFKLHKPRVWNVLKMLKRWLFFKHSDVGSSSCGWEVCNVEEVQCAHGQFMSAELHIPQTAARSLNCCIHIADTEKRILQWRRPLWVLSVTPGLAFLLVAMRLAYKNAISSTVCIGSIVTDWLTKDFAGHLLFAGGFGLIGYWAHGVKQSQEQLLHKKQEQLVERRQA